jgi:hypothetical protein
MGKVIKLNINKMETQTIRTEEQLRTENQEGKSALVENISEQFTEISKAFSVMKYEDKHFIGFMGAMVTEPTEDLEGLVESLKGIDVRTWDILLNVVTTIVSERKAIDKLKTEKNG